MSKLLKQIENSLLVAGPVPLLVHAPAVALPQLKLSSIRIVTFRYIHAHGSSVSGESPAREGELLVNASIAVGDDKRRPISVPVE